MAKSNNKFISLRYPQKTIGSGKDFDRLDDYLYIRVLNYEPPGLAAIEGTTFGIGSANNARDTVDKLYGTKQIATIILPIPDKIQDNNGAEWTAGNMNPLAALVSGQSFEAVRSEEPMKQALKGVQDSFSNIDGVLKGNKDSIAGGTAGLVANALFGQAGINQVTSRATGQVFNQNTEFLFNGLQVRPAFQFTFDLTPRNKSEAMEVKEIIRTFKYHMAPKSSARPAARGAVRRGSGTREGLFVQAPDVFQLRYKMGNKDHPFLHKFKLCALTQMSVDYTGSGQHSTYADGTPVHMKLSLQFQELSPIFAEDQYEAYEESKGEDRRVKGVGF